MGKGLGIYIAVMTSIAAITSILCFISLGFK